MLEQGRDSQRVASGIDDYRIDDFLPLCSSHFPQGLGAAGRVRLMLFVDKHSIYSGLAEKTSATECKTFPIFTANAYNNMCYINNI